MTGDPWLDGTGESILQLGLLALPVATVAWTVTHEEIFREVREACQRRSATSRSLAVRKFFYLFTCEYCFSHYVAAAAVALTGFELLLTGWRGAGVAWLALVAVANVYMSLFARVRVELKSERLDVALKAQVADPVPPPSVKAPAARAR